MRFNPYETHHGYYGIALMLLAWVLSSYTTWSLWMYMAGVVLFLDDLYQHIRQGREPEYHSPIHQIYGKYIYKFKTVQKLNRFFDRLFRKK